VNSETSTAGRGRGATALSAEPSQKRLGIAQKREREKQKGVRNSAEKNQVGSNKKEGMLARVARVVCETVEGEEGSGRKKESICDWFSSGGKGEVRQGDKGIAEEQRGGEWGVENWTSAILKTIHL